MHYAKQQHHKQTSKQQEFHEKTMRKQKKMEANKPVRQLYFFFAAFFLVFLADLATILTSKP
jgi:hypothetical protein